MVKDWRQVLLETLQKCRSNYIPVIHPKIPQESSFWRNDSLFWYPFALINLQQLTPQEKQQLEIPSWVTFATDSGGFQVIRGMCQLSWLESLQNQIDLSADMIFSFDKPPVTPLNAESTKLIAVNEKEYYRILEENFIVAIKQAQYLKENHPHLNSKFYYIIHAKDYETLMWHNNKILETGGFENFKTLFGGICYGVKKDNPFWFTTFTNHANCYFIKNGFKVHFLGIGSPTKFIYMVKNDITTFDSSNAARGFFANEYFVPYTKQIRDKIILKQHDRPFNSNPCICQVCSVFDCSDTKTYNVYALFLHNLLKIAQEVIFLNSIKPEQFNEIVSGVYQLSSEQKLALEYIDSSQCEGFRKAFETYKHKFTKIGETIKAKQTSLYGY